MVVTKLDHWIKVKKYPDDFSIAEDSECEYGYNEEDMEGEYPCNCECKRKNKVLVQIYSNKSYMRSIHKKCISGKDLQNVPDPLNAG